jgi:hypothetical protein
MVMEKSKLKDTSQVLKESSVVSDPKDQKNAAPATK